MRLRLVLSALCAAFAASACEREKDPGFYSPIIVHEGSDDPGFDHVPFGYSGGESGDESDLPPCDPEEIDPYDLHTLVSYKVDTDDETLERLASATSGWYYPGTDTYEQINAYGWVEIGTDGCAPFLFTDVKIDPTARNMGEQPVLGEASWIVDYNDVNADQKLGGDDDSQKYDDGRWWWPGYDGPVNVAWLYNYAMAYVRMKHRDAAWMELGTGWWDGQEAVYNSLEPIKEDMANRLFGKGNWQAVWTGYELSSYPYSTETWVAAECDAGDCYGVSDRAQECYDLLMSVSNRTLLLTETADCYDWDQITSIIAFQIWFAHWDGCGSNNCWQYAWYPPGAEQAQIGMGVTGVDLLMLLGYTDVETVSLDSSAGEAGYACMDDTSDGGCQSMVLSKLDTLTDASRSGQMEADLREVYAIRQEIGAALDGDEDWVNRSVDWVNMRADIMDAAIDTYLFPCGHGDSAEEDTFVDLDTAIVPPPGGGGVDTWYDGGHWSDPCDTGSSYGGTETGGETGHGETGDTGTALDTAAHG